MTQVTNKKTDEMIAPGILESLIYPHRKKAYRKYKEHLLQDLINKKEAAKEKARNGATSTEIKAAYGEAWKAEAIARKHIKG